MISNVNPETGVRYGIIACNSLDQDLVNDLFYGPGAVDLSYEDAYEEAKAEAGTKYDDLMEQAEIAASETDGGMSEFDRAVFISNWLEENDTINDREMFIDREMDSFSDRRCQIDEPTIEGEVDGVKYRITWLGGAPLLFVFEGPTGNARSLCSPCVPNAADLDSGFVLDSELEGGPEWAEIGVSEFDHDNGFPCYCVPRDWLDKEQRS